MSRFRDRRRRQRGGFNALGLAPMTGITPFFHTCRISSGPATSCSRCESSSRFSVTFYAGRQADVKVSTGKTKFLWKHRRKDLQPFRFRCLRTLISLETISRFWGVSWYIFATTCVSGRWISEKIYAAACAPRPSILCRRNDHWNFSFPMWLIGHRR